MGDRERDEEEKGSRREIRRGDIERSHGVQWSSCSAVLSADLGPGGGGGEETTSTGFFHSDCP